MSLGSHESINATLRAAMADLIGGSWGQWGLLGCYRAGTGVTWRSLNELTIAAATGTDITARDGIDLRRCYDALAALTAAWTDRACRVATDDLVGIAMFGLINVGTHRVCLVDAVFIDGFRHTISWRVDQPAPRWQIYSPTEQACDDDPLPAALPDLLETVAHSPRPGASSVSDVQNQLGLALRVYFADRVVDGSSAIFLIRAVIGGWSFDEPAPLAERLYDKVDAGASMHTALRELADELEAAPMPDLPTGHGFGTVHHVESDDGATVASLIAYFDQTCHLGVWFHHQPAPDWNAIPVRAIDPGLSEVLALYARLAKATGPKRR